MRSHVRPSPAACDGNRSDDDERRSRAELDAPSADRRGEFVRRWSCLSGREGWYYSRGRGVGGGDADDGPRGSPMLRREERIEAVANFYRMVDLYGIDRNIVHSAMALFDVVCSKGIGVVAPTDTDTELLCALHTCFWMSFKLNSTNGHVFSSAQFGRIVGFSIAACHLERLEMTICKGMDWRLNPPIPSSYVELVDPLLEEVLGNGGLAPLRKEIRALAYDLIDASNSNDGLNVAAPVGEEGRARSTSTGGGNERGWGGNPPGYDQFRADPAFCSMLMDTSRACIGASADVPGGVFVRGLLNTTDDQLKSSSDWNSDQTIKSYATEVILHKTTS